MIDLAKTVSPLEITWTVICLVGSLIAAWNWWDAQGDIDHLRASGRNGVIMITARGERSDQIALFVALVCKMLVGVLAMSSLPSENVRGDPSLSAIFSPWLFIIVGLLLIFLSVSKRRRRISLREALLERYP